MHDLVKARVTVRLRAELHTRFPQEMFAATAIDTAAAAQFYGNLMLSALQSPAIVDKIERGSVICWALVVRGEPYGVGLHHTADGGWEPFLHAFGFANKASKMADDLDDIWRAVVSDLTNEHETPL